MLQLPKQRGKNWREKINQYTKTQIKQYNKKNINITTDLLEKSARFFFNFYVKAEITKEEKLWFDLFNQLIKMKWNKMWTCT